jgi:hypothetical protein
MPWPAGLRELTAAAGRRRPTHLFYSNFDWLGLLFGRQQYQPTPRSSTYLPTYLRLRYLNWSFFLARMLGVRRDKYYPSMPWLPVSEN